MKIFISGTCQPDKIFELVDPTVFSEEQFEAHVKTALGCVYRDYYCIPFRGGFKFEDVVHIADLALIHKTFSHWFILEVELASHSLQNHVVPQVRCFQYGTPLESCLHQLCQHIPNFTIPQAQTLIKFVPRSVAVIANRIDPVWMAALASVSVQLMAVSIFMRQDGGYALETDGSLSVPRESLGFFTYSALNRTIRISRSCSLPAGRVQIEDPFGMTGCWTVRVTEDALWVTKDVGDPGLPDRIILQVLRTHTGKIILKVPVIAS